MFYITLIASLLFSMLASAAVLEVGPTKTYKTPCAAVQAARPGDRIEVAAGSFIGAQAPCRITTPDLYIVAVGGRVLLNARDSSNYAYNVLRQGVLVVDLPSGALTLEKIDIIGAAVSPTDGNNGAAVRVQNGDFNAIDCGFYFNQNGLLTGTTGSIHITRSHYAWNGTGIGTEHNIYVSTGAKELIFEQSISRNSPGGQCVKSRAAKTSVLYSLLGEASAATGGNSNFEISTPNGGDTKVIGCVILQSPQSTNGHIVNSGEEGVTHAVNKFTMLHNTLAGYSSPNVFVRLAASFPGTVVVRNNLYAGPGTLYEGKQPTQAAGNYWATTIAAAQFMAAADYRLKPTSPAIATAAPIDPLLVPYQPVIPFAVELRFNWASSGAYALGSIAPPMSIPVIPYPRPAAPAGYQTISSTGGSQTGSATPLRNPDTLTPVPRAILADQRIPSAIGLPWVQ